MKTIRKNFQIAQPQEILQPRRICLLAALALASLNCGHALAAAAADQYQQMFDQGQYQALLPQLNAAIAKKTDKIEAADRYSLLMLKGETLLHLKAASSAADAFTAAAQAATDDKSVAVAKATANLIKHSGSSKYQPKAKATGSTTLAPAIDIIEPSSRKEAFSAFLTDLLAPLAPQVANADNLATLSSIMTLTQQVGDARNVEIAAIGGNAQTKDLLDKLAARAATLMAAALKPLDGQIATVTKTAAKRAKQLGNRATKDASECLSNDDVSQLGNIVTQARQISDAITQTQPLYGENKDLKTITTDAEKIITSANKVLTQYKYPPV